MTLSPQDHEDIRQLLARYNFAIDEGDAAGWAACFTGSGTFECRGLPDGAPLGGRHEGRDALVAYAEVHQRINKGRARHWNWNLLVDGDGDLAAMRCYMAVLRAGLLPDAVVSATGIYADRLERTDGGWRFAERVVTVDS